MMAMAQQKAGELLARLPQHAHRRQPRGDRSRTASWAGLEPTPATVHPLGAIWPGYRVASVGFDPIAGLARNQGDYAGRSVYFSSLADIVATLIKAERGGALRERIRYYCRFALVIVDEIGYSPSRQAVVISTSSSSTPDMKRAR